MGSVLRRPFAWAVLMAVMAYVLGYFGYRSLPEESVGPTDALYRAMQLFTVDENAAPGSKPWQLEVARFAAPLSVAFATAIAVAVYLRDGLRLALVLIRARNHVVLVGLGDTGAALAWRLREEGQQVVVIDRDQENPLIPGVVAVGAAVIVGDARQRAILRRAQVARASHVVVSLGDDGRNLDVAELVRSERRDEAWPAQKIHVAIASPDLWAEIGTLHLSASPGSALVEHFCQVDRAAQALLDEAEGETAGADHYVDGDGALLERVVTHLARRALVEGRTCRITASVHGEIVLKDLIAREPWITAAIERAGIDDPRVSPSALICTEAEDSVALTRAITAARVPGRDRVFVSLREPVAPQSLVVVRTPARVVPVSVDSATTSRDIIGGSAIEIMARARHEEYRARQRSNGDDDNPSLVPWNDLAPSLQQSNRRFAESVGAIIDAAGGHLVPLVGRVPDAPWIDPDALEAMAVAEHERWASALTSDGWHFAPGLKDPDRKTHPSLVPWNELSAAEQEKDRDAIRAIPAILARVGYAVRLA